MVSASPSRADGRPSRRNPYRGTRAACTRCRMSSQARLTRSSVSCLRGGVGRRRPRGGRLGGRRRAPPGCRVAGLRASAAAAGAAAGAACAAAPPASRCGRRGRGLRRRRLRGPGLPEPAVARPAPDRCRPRRPRGAAGAPRARPPCGRARGRVTLTSASSSCRRGSSPSRISRWACPSDSMKNTTSRGEACPARCSCSRNSSPSSSTVWPSVRSVASSLAASPRCCSRNSCRRWRSRSRMNCE